MTKQTRIVFCAPSELVSAVRTVLDVNHLTYGALFIPVMQILLDKGLHINPPKTTPSMVAPVALATLDELSEEDLDALDFPDES
jgi:hypothetical protein